MFKKICSLLVGAGLCLSANPHKQLSHDAQQYQATGKVSLAPRDLAQAHAAQCMGWLIGATSMSLGMAHMAGGDNSTPDLKKIPKIITAVAFCGPAIAYMYAHFVHSTQAFTQRVYAAKVARILQEIEGREGDERKVDYLSDLEEQDQLVYQAYPERILTADDGTMITDAMGTPVAQPC